MVSLTIEAASTTVGTPMAIVGIPKISLDISFLLFPTPLPGLIPASVIWIVLLTLSTDEAAKASMVITKPGFISLTTLFNKSLVSIPVSPITPGARVHTLLNPSSNVPYKYM